MYDDPRVGVHLHPCTLQSIQKARNMTCALPPQRTGERARYLHHASCEQRATRQDYAHILRCPATCCSRRVAGASWFICTRLLHIRLSKEMLFASFWNASELQWTSLALMRRLLLKIRQLLPPQIPCAHGRTDRDMDPLPVRPKTLKSNVSCACDAKRHGNEYAPCRSGCVHENIA